MTIIQNLKDKVHAVQTFYVGTSYIYTLQRRRNDSDNELKDLTFSRLQIEKDANGKPTGNANQVEDPMILVGFGHSQVLQYFTHGTNATPYFWIATRGSQTNKNNPNSKKPDLTYWPTQLARVQYSSGTTLEYTQATRLISLRYASNQGTSIGNVLRVEAALSSDKSKLLIMTINTDNPRKASLTEYNNKELNNALDQVAGTSSPTLGCDSKAVKDASTGKGLKPGFSSKSIFSLSYYGSIQGTELADNDAIYLSASNTERDGIALSKVAWGTKEPVHKKVDNSNWVSGQTEDEAIQLSGDNVLIGITMYPGVSVENRIYRFPKSAFN
ncbi:helveticin J family class III bacteriocin [Lentilactobacillus otakiensis]|nr:helveticin J family class III bacteriocin [Lentilactobacillus otakiensis]KRL08778.1 hypothetical protein FD05_GL001629 [Lentilactobacillus otakiensis DSM 19908 = JCM 15040]